MSAHSHSHGHGHSHHHHGSHVTNRKVLFFAFLLTLIFALSETFFGFLYGALSLISESFHMLSDGISLFLSYIAVILGAKLATTSRAFGYRRIETIAAFLNGLALLAIPVFVVYEAVERMMNHTPIMGEGMLIVACLGLVVNLLVAYILSKGNREENLNLKAAFLHVFADITSSVGVIIAAILIMNFGWNIVDPIISVIVSIVIFIGGIKVTKEAFNVLMEGTPHDVDYEEIKSKITSVPGIEKLSNLKIWCIASGENYLNAHIIINNDVDEQVILKQIKELLCEHEVKQTIQIEKTNL